MRLGEILSNLESYQRDVDSVKNASIMMLEDAKDVEKAANQALKGLDGMLQSIYKQIEYTLDPIDTKKTIAAAATKLPNESNESYMARMLSKVVALEDEVSKYGKKEYERTHGKVINEKLNKVLELNSTYKSKYKSAIAGIRKMKKALEK